MFSMDVADFVCIPNVPDCSISTRCKISETRHVRTILKFQSNDVGPRVIERPLITAFLEVARLK